MSYEYRGAAITSLLVRQQQELARLQKACTEVTNTAAARAAAFTAKARTEANHTLNQATATKTAANTEARRIIDAAITAADKIRHDADRNGAATRARAEHDANRIRERAYLEGRVRADTNQIHHDHSQTGDTRRKQLDQALRR